jgi:hypothetical protein
MQAKPLINAIAEDAPIRDAGLFGVFGGHVNVTDGRYVYMRAPVGSDSKPLFNYTLMPMHMTCMFETDELRDAQLVPPFSFSKDCPMLKIPAEPFMARAHQFGTLLFDLHSDPHQQKPLNDQSVERRMIEHLLRLMVENDAPVEQYERLGLRAPDI